jgi:voltage-gated potassium channel
MNFFSKKDLKKYFSMKETKKSLKMDYFILFLIFLSLFIFIALTYNLSPNISKTLLFLDYIILILFTIEFGIRFYVSTDRKKFWKSKYIWIDLMAIIPFWFGHTDLQFLRILRFFRLYRYSEKYLNVGHLLDSKKFQKLFTTKVIFTLLSIFIVAAGLIYDVEHKSNPGINNFSDAFYFTVSTATTVGFGDIVAVTDLGRWVVILTIFTGIIMIPYYATVLVKFISLTSKKSRINCKVCGLKFHEPNSNFCKACGANLYHIHESEYFVS